MTPKWPCILQGQRQPRYVYYSSTESQISHRFNLQPVIFELQSILTQNDPKMTLNTTSKAPHICCTRKPESKCSVRFAMQKCISFYRQPFWSYRSFWEKCTEWPQIIFNITRSKVPHIYSTSNRVQHFSPGFAVCGHLFKLQAIMRQMLWVTLNCSFSCSVSFSHWAQR